MYIKNHNKFYNINGFQEISWNKNCGIPNLAIVEVVFPELVEDCEGYPMQKSIIIDLDNTCNAAIENGEYSRIEEIIEDSDYSDYEKGVLIPLLYDALAEKVYTFITNRILVGDNAIDISDIIDDFIDNTLETAPLLLVRHI